MLITGLAMRGSVTFKFCIEKWMAVMRRHAGQCKQAARGLNKLPLSLACWRVFLSFCARRNSFPSQIILWVFLEVTLPEPHVIPACWLKQGPFLIKFCSCGKTSGAFPAAVGLVERALVLQLGRSGFSFQLCHY